MDGKIILNGKSYGGTTKGSTIKYGLDVPSAGDGLDGDLFILTNGIKIINLYLNVEGTWIPFLTE